MIIQHREFSGFTDYYFGFFIMNNNFEDLMNLLKMSVKPVRLEPITIKSCELLKTNLPVPPQLYTALGYKTQPGVRLGKERDNHKIAVSNHWQTRVSSLPGWDFYENHGQIYPYFLWLRGKSIDLYTDEFDGCSKHGFVLDEQDLYLGEVQIIKQLLIHNQDYRPSWVKKATLEDFNNPEFSQRYQKWNEEQYPMLPRFDNNCQLAIREMANWLENRN